MFTGPEIESFQSWYRELQTKSGIRNQHTNATTDRELWIQENPCPVQDKIKSLYDAGHGYKFLAAGLETTYPVIRNLILKYMTTIEPRRGQSVVTDILREKRRDNVSGEKSPWFDWPNKYPELHKNSVRSIQGYYISPIAGKVWLRSTYEFVYAKWLDRNNFNWRFEVQSYVLPDGQRYRPDFFIYDEHDNLVSVVEIKSSYYHENRAHKFFMFKEAYPDINASIIFNIGKFTTKESNYPKELKEWKKTRLS